jgi:hypothetical protein
LRFSWKDFHSTKIPLRTPDRRPSTKILADVFCCSLLSPIALGLIRMLLGYTYLAARTEASNEA